MINWRERIIEANAAKRKWTEAERLELMSFATCLVGEQHMKYPEVVVYHVGFPVDELLYKLGTCAGVFGPKTAEKVLDKIEDRVLQLKRGEK